MTLATQLTAAATAAGIDRSSPGAIFAVISDDHNTHSLSEPLLDVWWASLSPERKAELFEYDMESDLLTNAPAALGAGDFLPEATYGRCHYCGCTDEAACQERCSWVDATHTLCSNPACLDQFNTEMANGAEPLIAGIKALGEMQRLTHAPLTLVRKEASLASL